MIVNLLNHTPLEVADAAISKCWDKSVAADKVCERIERVANKNKHASTIEHLVYNFDIDGISRACLQEVARHRIASYSVKSTRYTLKELGKDDADIYEFYVKSGEPLVDNAVFDQLYTLHELIRGTTIANDKLKYMLPEAYKTSLVMTINARSLQNFIALRTSKSALWEIQDLANALFEALPEDHKYLFEQYLSK